jgi:hypothetical protein
MIRRYVVLRSVYFTYCYSVLYLSSDVVMIYLLMGEGGGWLGRIVGCREDWGDFGYL